MFIALEVEADPGTLPCRGHRFEIAVYPGIAATMNKHPPENQRRALGEFLRAQRERIAPAALGLPGGPRRRTPGLRREEAAQLCGLSATWYTWIEQGRDVSVSPSTLAHLARGLQMSQAERAYLFELAGKRDPDWISATPEDIPPPVLACVDAIDAPAYILDRYWTARRWNGAAMRLFAGWLDRGGAPNLLRFVFLCAEARRLICGWEERAHRVAAEFRAAITGHVDDPALKRLVDELRRDSADFARFWDAQAVLRREGGERTFNHPSDGFLRYQQVSLTVAGWPDFRLTMLLPAS
jgi:transcriptional regulator with XRE-family HTH domain